MIKQHELSNGIRIIYEQLPHFRSVSIGVWVAAGSTRENAEQAGISHFIEHMLFKGTKNRTAHQIATETDVLGGQLNAFTSKECTCYYTKVMDEHLGKACDILSDIVLNSTLDEGEMEKEKGVVVEEILMGEDTPDDLVQEVLSLCFYNGHPLGEPILGSKDSVSAFKQADLRAYMAEHYTAPNTIISVAGSFDEAELLALLEASFSAMPKGKAAPELPPVTLGGKRAQVRAKEIEQRHIALALPGFSMVDEKYYQMMVLNNIFGGSMSSRLFQKIREEKGLAYSVYSYAGSNSLVGTLGIYAGTAAEQGEQVLELILGEMRSIAKDGVTRDEYERSRDQLKSGYVLGSETTGSRMMTLGRLKLLYDKAMSEEQVLALIDQVKYEDMAPVAQELFNVDNLCGAFVGPGEKPAEQWLQLW